MAFPASVVSVLERFGVQADTRAALYDLYLALGNAAIDEFASIVERVGDPVKVQPEDLVFVRSAVVERYLRLRHPEWCGGNATPSLWHPRALEGRAAGLVVPAGMIEQAGGELSAFAATVESVACRIVGANQPLPAGILLSGRNSHYGGRDETITFDVVAGDLEDAVAIALAEGRQHTVPGSVGATSGSLDPAAGMALLWEIQPNVYKPSAGRNASIRAVYRKHRNWHVITCVAALLWLEARGMRVFVLRGDALAATHEADPNNPVSRTIGEFHDRTVERVVKGLGWALRSPDASECEILLESHMLNTGLRDYVVRQGVAAGVAVIE